MAGAAGVKGGWAGKARLPVLLIAALVPRLAAAPRGGALRPGGALAAERRRGRRANGGRT